jgi:hypothetical protein
MVRVFAGLPVVAWLAVWETDTVLVLELVALSESLGDSDESGVDDTEALGLTDSDSAGLTELRAVPDALGVVVGLEVAEADPESL